MLIAGVLKGLMSIVRKTASDNERGTTMVEFAMVLPVLFLIILSAVDFSLILYRQAALTFVAAELTREAASDVSLIPDGHLCSTVENSLDIKALNRALAEYGWVEIHSLASSVSQNPGAPYWVVQVDLTAPNMCVSCNIMPFLATISVSSKSVVENIGFKCT